METIELGGFQQVQAMLNLQQEKIDHSIKEFTEKVLESNLEVSLNHQIENWSKFISESETLDLIEENLSAGNQEKSKKIG
jgi:hypothetical protein